MPSLSPYLGATVDRYVCLRITEFKLALIQLAVSADKALNLCRACDMIRNAVKNGAQLVVLPVRHSTPHVLLCTTLKCIVCDMVCNHRIYTMLNPSLQLLRHIVLVDWMYSIHITMYVSMLLMLYISMCRGLCSKAVEYHRRVEGCVVKWLNVINM